MSAMSFLRTFPNGLTLLAEPMNWLESAAFTLLVPAGCAYEPEDRGGLATFTSEMTIRGAGPRDSRRLLDDLDNLGVERSESVFDTHIRYSGATLADNLLESLEIYADILRRPHLPAEQVEPARQVLLQDLRAVEDDPAQKVMIELQRRHYPYPWGRPSQGDRPALEATGLEDVRAFHRRHFHARGSIVSVAGKFDWPRLEQCVERLLGDWEAGPAPTVSERRSGPRQSHVPFDSNQTQIGIAYASVPYRSAEYFQAWGAMGVLSGGMSARLFTEVRERRGLCYSIFASYHTLRHLGAVLCYAGTGAPRAQETLDVTLAELVRLGDGVQADELARLKARIKSALIMQQESSSARSSAIARDWYHLGRTRSLEELASLVDGLSCQSINAYLSAHPPADFTVVTLGPQPLEVHVGVS